MIVEIEREEPPPAVDRPARSLPPVSVFRREIHRHLDWVDAVILLRGSGCRRRNIDLQNL